MAIVRNLPKIDLDAFIADDDPDEKKKSNITMPDSDKITVVGILTDDSGSIGNSGLRSDLVDGVALAIKAMKGAKGADFYINIRGFKQTYYDGLLKAYDDSFGAAYNPTYSLTPLVQCAIQQYRSLRTKIEEYAAQGIPASVAQVIITDGLPYNDNAYPEDFKKEIKRGDFIVGIGVQNGEVDEAKYRHVFTSMGIVDVMTPKASSSAIRHAINEFSRSVVSGSLLAG